MSGYDVAACCQISSLWLSLITWRNGSWKRSPISAQLPPVSNAQSLHLWSHRQHHRRQHRQRHRQRPQRVGVTVICWHLLEVSLSEKILRMPESIVLIFSPDGQILEKTQDNTSEQSAGSKFLICSDCWLKMVKETQRTNQVTNLLFCFGRLTGHMCCQTFICLLESL